LSIEVRALSHIYMQGSPFQAVALHDVSLTIPDGQFVGLIGHTGSGKSTLVQHLNGLIKPTSGEVLVDGQSLTNKNTDLRAVRRKVGLVFQYPEYQLFEETVFKDIAFGPSNLGLSQGEIDERVREAAALVGVNEDLLERSPFELSGGQKRRVSIAGVLAMRPATLILDEPAAGLDPKGHKRMMDIMRQLHERGGMTLIMVSHSMSDVAMLCSRILVMNQGTMAMDGSPEEIFMLGGKLEELGLGLPESAELSERLRSEGFKLPPTVWKMQQLAEILPGLLRAKGGAGHGV
jgi:energy-coupling factor transport system ATP-binding protein